MTEQEVRMLARVAEMTNVDALRQIAKNARGKSEVVERAAVRRIAELSPAHRPGTVEHACWSMVYAVEELRRLNGRKVWRMNHMRPKIQTEGEIAALEYCALQKTDGFSEIIGYGTPELTAEAIVLRHPEHFSQAARAAAYRRLQEAGVQIEAATKDGSQPE